MKNILKSLAVALAAASLASAPAFAKECCDAATAKVKSGEACEKCVEGGCCKSAAKKASKELAKSGTAATECKTCASKPKDGAKKS